MKTVKIGSGLMALAAVACGERFSQSTDSTVLSDQKGAIRMVDGGFYKAEVLRRGKVSERPGLYFVTPGCELPTGSKLIFRTHKLRGDWAQVEMLEQQGAAEKDCTVASPTQANKLSGRIGYLYLPNYKILDADVHHESGELSNSFKYSELDLSRGREVYGNFSLAMRAECQSRHPSQSCNHKNLWNQSVFWDIARVQGLTIANASNKPESGNPVVLKAGHYVKAVAEKATEMTAGKDTADTKCVINKGDELYLYVASSQSEQPLMQIITHTTTTKEGFVDCSEQSLWQFPITGEKVLGAGYLHLDHFHLSRADDIYRGLITVGERNYRLVQIGDHQHALGGFTKAMRERCSVLNHGKACLEKDVWDHAVFDHVINSLNISAERHTIDTTAIEKGSIEGEDIVISLPIKEPGNFLQATAKEATFLEGRKEADGKCTIHKGDSLRLRVVGPEENKTFVQVFSHQSQIRDYSDCSAAKLVTITGTNDKLAGTGYIDFSKFELANANSMKLGSLEVGSINFTVLEFDGNRQVLGAFSPEMRKTCDELGAGKACFEKDLWQEGIFSWVISTLGLKPERR